MKLSKSNWSKRNEAFETQIKFFLTFFEFSFDGRSPAFDGSNEWTVLGTFFASQGT